jgi:membrane protein DedA with SNARE-associated domain
MIPFHRLLISSAIVFCVGFALWSGWDYRQSRSIGTLVVALVFVAAAIALTYYLRNLKRFLGR